ncbi:hypothetical protein [Hathewaya limosa]|uniref:Uncharacterized protein n=1 Tax=Hathewaya limosa TaxID=1536 RepID=A0ABU0JQN0_HATLI|nr:hypothetical protein [Hathewaya limosa]AWZ48090.1 hypothetical protein C3495_04350 [Clostridiaceae bacterium 14S0207]MDQ0479403.1 hypothetical protein [Hathewaya limosa]
MLNKEPEVFIYWWSTLRNKGKKNFIVKKHILRNEFIYSLIYILGMVIYKAEHTEFTYKLGLITYVVGFLVVSVLSYIFSKTLWEHYSKEYLKLNLTNLVKTTKKIHIVNKVKE